MVEWPRGEGMQDRGHPTRTESKAVAGRSDELASSLRDHVKSVRSRRVDSG